MYKAEYSVPKMVGRDKKLDQLKQFLRATIDGRGNTVLLSGEAGIGKSRLVKELIPYAESLGVRVLEGRCLYESPTPFLPFREAVRSVFQVSKSDALPLQERKIRKVIKESAPEFVQAIPVVGNLIAGFAVAYRTYRDEKGREKRVELGALFERDKGLETLSSLLVTISGKQPLLLFIDDLHLADTASLSLLYYLARVVQNSKILVVGAYRPEEVTKIYEGTLHPLLDIIHRMSRYDLVQKIELKRLNQDDYFDLVQSMLNVDLGNLAILIYHEAEGNPFFAIETIKLLIQQKVLVKEDGRWSLSGDIEDIDIPHRVCDVIIRRVNVLKEEERVILDCASVVGKEFSSNVIENVLDLNPIVVLRNLNNIERKHLLISSTRDGFRFDHQLIREVLYNEIAPELRKMYHSRIAKYIEDGNKNRLEGVINELAHHCFRSGNAQKGVPYLLEAGDKSRERWAPFEAVRYYSQALETIGNDEKWIEENVKAWEALGDVYAITDKPEKANKCYEEGISRAKDNITRDRMQRKIRKKMTLDKNGVKLAYYVYGEGSPTLVFVTPWFWTAALWIPQVSHFSQSFKIITIDMRGAGESDKPAGDYARARGNLLPD